MKTIFMLFLLLFAMNYANAQVRPEAYLSNLPSVPEDICSDETQGKDEFLSKVNEISGELQTEMERRHENNDAKVEANKPKMMDNAMRQTGVSPELTQKMMDLENQSKGATGDQKKAYEAQKKALADQMMQQSMNISMGEIENLKKMDKAGQKAWATAYATEKQAEVAADPKKFQDQNAREMQKYNLLQSQKQLRDSLNAQQNRYMKKFAEIDEDEIGKKLLNKIEGIRKEIADLYTETAKIGTSPDENKLIALRSDMKKAKVSYCNLQSPKYINVLAEYKSFIQSSMSAYYRLEKLSNEVAKMQTGVDISPEPGEFGLGNVSSYIKQLLGAYKYNLYGPEDWTIG
ncbi:MAG: hypothetical protein WC542_04415 [Paludibacter sp.]